MQKVLVFFPRITAENEFALSQSGMGRYHKRQGKMEQTRGYLTKALEIFEWFGMLIEPDEARKELGELTEAG